MLRFVAVGSPSFSRFEARIATRYVSGTKDNESNKNDHYSSEKVNSMVGHNFPDFIERWNRDNFKMVGNGLIAATTLCAVGGAVSSATVASMIPSAVIGALTAGYWYVGSNDIRQTTHALRRNFPVIGNLRYMLETVRFQSIVCEDKNEIANCITLYLSILLRFVQNCVNTLLNLTMMDDHTIDCIEVKYINVLKM
jgi:hypothetical protein